LQLEVLEIVHSSSRDAQVAIAQDAFKLLLHKSYKNRALVIFRQENNAQYRLSLLQIEAVQDDHSSRIRRSYSNPRRYSFLLGEGAHVKTPYQFLIRNGKLKPVDGDYFKDLQSRFSVETLTKLFYKELSDWYFWAMDQVEFPDDEDHDRKSRNAKSLIRLITRIIFIWFMKEKRLISASLFDKSYVDTLLNYGDATGSTYYKAILQNLFFATLNTPMRKDNPQSRIFIEDAKKSGSSNDGYLQQGYYRYSRFIKDKEAFLEEFDNIPF
jgi:hypothetical protein